MFASQSSSTDNSAVQKLIGLSPTFAIDVSNSGDGIMSISFACSMRPRALSARNQLDLVLEDLFLFPNASNKESRISSGKWSLLKMIKRATYIVSLIQLLDLFRAYLSKKIALVQCAVLYINSLSRA